jgi:hypothetical protein
VGHPALETALIVLGTSRTPSDRAAPDALNGGQQRRPALLLEHFADEPAKQPNVVSQLVDWLGPRRRFPRH